MYKVNDYVVYKKDVCQVKEIKDNYYVLSLVNDESLIIKVPVSSEENCLRNIMSKKEALTLINNIPNIEPLSDINDKYIEKYYKDLLHNGTHEDLIKIIKTTYLRNDDRSKNKRKLSEKDSNYFAQAEKYLYNEIAVALNMSFEDAKDYIIKKVQELIG